MIFTSILLYFITIRCLSLASIFPLTYHNSTENNSKCIDQLVEILISKEENAKFAFTINTELKTNVPVINWDIHKQFNWDRFVKISLYVMRIENDLEELLKALENSDCLYPRATFVIVSKEVNVNIFRTLANYFIVSVLVVTDTDEIFTYNPYVFENLNEPYLEYSKSSCGDAENAVYSFLRAVKYPIKWRNSTINTLYFPIAPYIFPCTKCNNFSKMFGIEIEIYKTIKDRVGFKVNFTEYTGDEWGPKIDGKYIDGLGLLQKREVHLMIGACNTHKEEHLDFDITTTYFKDSCNWLVPRIESSITLTRFLKIFTLPVWLLTLCTLVSITILLFVITGNFNQELFTTFQIVIETGVYNFQRTTRHSRLILVLFTLCSLVISTIFKNQLFVILSSQKLRNGIDTFDDLLQSDLRIMLSNRMVKVMAVTTDPKEKQIFKRLYPTPDMVHLSMLNAVAFEKNTATVSIRSMILYVLTKGYINKEGNPLLHILDKPIYVMNVQMFFTKGYPVKEEVNKYIRYCVASGLLVKEKRDKEYDLTRDIYRREIYVFGAQKLGFKGLEWYFYMWGGGLVFSILMFIVELLVYRFTKSV